MKIYHQPSNREVIFINCKSWFEHFPTSKQINEQTTIILIFTSKSVFRKGFRRASTCSSATNEIRAHNFIVISVKIQRIAFNTFQSIQFATTK